MVIDFYPKEGAYSYNNGDPDDNITVESDSARVMIYGYNGVMSADFPYCKRSLEIVERLRNVFQSQRVNLLNQETPAIRFGHQNCLIAAYNARDVKFVGQFLDGLWDVLQKADKEGILPEQEVLNPTQEIDNPFIQ